MTTLDFSSTLAGMTLSDAALTTLDLEPYRRELTGYCYRMLGSGFEAEDAVQETMVRAWRKADTFEGRSSVRSWLYKIATNVCIDMQRQVQRRARPMDLQSASPPHESRLGPVIPESAWITPIADAAVSSPTDPIGADPAEVSEQRESIRLAFVTALQHLPARQRAALVLCEVLRWQATEVAALLETSVAAVNSALQRARATLADVAASGGRTTDPLDPTSEAAAVVARYADAFERYDMDELVTLLHADAVMSMPPFPMWIQGAADVCEWMVQPGPRECTGSRLVAITANGCPGFAQYRPDPAGGYTAWSIQILEVTGGKIASINHFLALMDPERLFPSFGLPVHLDG